MMKIWPRTHESASSQFASLSPMFFGDQTLSFRFASGDLTESRISVPGDDVQANEENSGRSPEKGYIRYVRDRLYHPSRADDFRGPSKPGRCDRAASGKGGRRGPPRVNWQRTTAPGRRAPARHPQCQVGQFLPVSLLMMSFALSSRLLSFSPAFCSSWPALSLRSLSSGPTLSLRSLSFSPALSLRSLSFSPALSTALPAAGAASLMAPPAFSSLVPVVLTPDSI